MHPLKKIYYETTIIATVQCHGASFVVAGGRADQKRLTRALQESHFCFVRDAIAHRNVKLVAQSGQWQIDS